MTIDEIITEIERLRSENADIMDRPHFLFLGELDSIVASARFIQGSSPHAPATGSLRATLRNLESTIVLCRNQDRMPIRSV